MLKVVAFFAICVAFSGCGTSSPQQTIARISDKEKADKEKEEERKARIEAIYSSAKKASQRWKKVTFDPVRISNLKNKDLAFIASGGAADKTHFLMSSAAVQYAAPSALGLIQDAARVEPLAIVPAQQDEKTIFVGESAWLLSSSSVGFSSKSLSEGKIAVRYPLGVNLDEKFLNSFESVVGRYESTLFLQHQEKILIVEVDRSTAERAFLSVSAFELPEQLWAEKIISVGRTDLKKRFWLITKKGLWFLTAGEDLENSAFASFPLEQLKKYPDLKFVSGVLVGNDLLPRDYLLGWSPSVGPIKIWLKPQR